MRTTQNTESYSKKEIIWHIVNLKVHGWRNSFSFLTTFINYQEQAIGTTTQHMIDGGSPKTSNPVPDGIAAVMPIILLIFFLW